MKKFFCVVSHTHWDREWYKPFEVFRLQLVDLIDHLMNTIKKYPEYVFHLDAQTVVLEDYLEIRPEKRDELKKLIADGNIIVGPWYLQNDFYLTSGEATIRNLLEGNRLAKDFGACSKVGYAPDQFGNISQLPQILSNFGIDNFVFGRGFSKFHKNEEGNIVLDAMPSEFIWRGADGTEALAVHMKYWYNNAQRFSADIDKAKCLTDRIENSFKDVAMTPYLLLMNGVDHLEAQDDLLPILDKLNSKGLNGHIEQVRLDEYIQRIRNYIKENSVPLISHTGELRMGSDDQILQGTMSSRHYLKVANVKAQNMLECRLEPLYAMLEASGCRNIYSNDHFRYLWKKLMQNHPHDSICGCSRDEIHRHMEDNFARIGEASRELLKRGLRTAAYHNEVALKHPEGYSLVAVNTLGKPVSGVVEAEIVFSAEDGVDGFDIYDGQGNKVDYALLSRETKPYDVFSPINLPGVITVDCCCVYLFVPEVQPVSFKGYSVRKSDHRPSVMERKLDNTPHFENEQIRLSVSPDGTITVEEKEGGRILSDCLYFEDVGDRGDSYIHRSTAEPPILSKDFQPTITVIEKNTYVSRCKLQWNMEVPDHYDFDSKQRSKVKTVVPVSLTLTLRKGQKTVELGYSVDNRAKDHRLRFVLNADVFTDSYKADIPFDIIEHTDGFNHPNDLSKTKTNTSLAAIEKEGKGVAVFTEGAHECEKIDQNKLAFTVVRSTGVITRDEKSVMIGGDQWFCPDNQCLRVIEGRVGLYLYTGDTVSAELPNRSQEFRNPLLACCVPCDRRKLSGGRPAVQDTQLSELFYLPDPYEHIELPDNRPLLKAEGKSILVSAFKKSENGQGLVVRLYNYGTAADQTTITIRGTIYRSDMSEKMQNLLGTNQVQLNIQPKKIVTLLVK